MKIYLHLPDEAVPVWCPVEAEHLEGDIYQIVEINSDPDGTRWAFNTGAKVRCKLTPTSDGQETILVAYEEILD